MGNYSPVISRLERRSSGAMSSMTETSFDDGHFLNLKSAPPTSSDSCCRNFCASLTVSQESKDVVYVHRVVNRYSRGIFLCVSLLG